jgi:cell division septum initiation protein DivIVA
MTKGLPTDFPLVEQGYDPGEVDEYLATQMLQLRQELEKANNRVAELEAELASANEREDAIRLTMIAATKARDDLLAEAKGEADEILGKARREALVLMKEAREEAEGTIAEGRDSLNLARQHAADIVAEANDETERMLAERKRDLERLHAEYEAESNALIDRINTLRSIADDLTNRITRPQPTPETPAPQPATPEPAVPEAAAPAPTPPTIPSANEGRTTTAPQPEDVPDHQSPGEAPTAERIRGSFSGRRSAKLPRIGEEAGRSALAAANAMRAHIAHEPDDSDTDGDDLEVRTA